MKTKTNKQAKPKNKQKTTQTNKQTNKKPQHNTVLND
jgi:hypothetical protein